MKNINYKSPYQSTVLSLAVTLAVLVRLAPVAAADSKSEPTSKTQESPQQKSQTETEKPKPVVRKLSGAELYSIHCNRCHPERYPTERTAAQWKTILLHMRVRANLPAEQSRTILKYLQDNSGR